MSEPETTDAERVLADFLNVCNQNDAQPVLLVGSRMVRGKVKPMMLMRADLDRPLTLQFLRAALKAIRHVLRRGRDRDDGSQI